MIKNLNSRLAEVGRIKIGCLDSQVRTTKDGTKWQAPKKLDHFLVTQLDERDKFGNFAIDEKIHARIGPKPTELRIVLIYNDPDVNFRTEYAYYQGRKCLCRGDGEQAVKVVSRETGECETVKCPCPLLDQENGGCKAHGTLHCLLTDAEIAGGVWRFATTSKTTIRNIDASLRFLHACTGGKVAGLPLLMRFYHKQTVTPKGEPTKIGVVGLFFEGSPVKMLEQAVEIQRKRIEAKISIETMEDQMRRELAADARRVVDIESDDEDLHPPADQDDYTSVADAAAEAARAAAASAPATTDTKPGPAIAKAAPENDPSKLADAAATKDSPAVAPQEKADDNARLGAILDSIGRNPGLRDTVLAIRDSFGFTSFADLRKAPPDKMSEFLAKYDAAVASKGAAQ